MRPKRGLLPQTILALSLLLAACDAAPAVVSPSPTQLTPQPSPSAPLPRALTPSPSAPAAQLSSPSVFVISWNSAHTDTTHLLMNSGALPHFAALAQNGLRAQYSQSVEPSLTAPAQASLTTGAYPNHTGIIADRYHDSNDLFYGYRSGFYEPLTEAEPVWVTALKHGMTSAALFAAGGTPELAAQTASYTAAIGPRNAPPQRAVIPLNPAGDWGPIPASYSPPLEGSFEIPNVLTLHLLALDTTDDSQPNYDLVFLNQTPGLTSEAQPLKVGEWASLELLPAAHAGADLLVQKITPAQVVIYQSAVNHLIAAPAEFETALHDKFSFLPPEPDLAALQQSWITAEDYLAMLDRRARWMAEVSAWVYTQYHPALVFTSQEVFDAAGRAFLLLNPDQPGYSAEKAKSFAAYYRRAAEIADRSLQIVLEAIDLKNTTLLLVSDHGLAPVHTTVYVNSLLVQAGLLVLDPQNNGIVDQSRAIAVAAGGTVNVYINLQGRERQGSVPVADYAAVQAQVIDLLRGVTDPRGRLVFGRVLRREEIAPQGLDSPHSGDVFAQANLGFELDGWRGKPQIFEQTKDYGACGYDSALPEMRGIFIAAGAGVRTPKILSPIKIVDYAPTIAYLLGFPAAYTVDGRLIPGFTQP